jgi:hypothetical protein
MTTIQSTKDKRSQMHIDTTTSENRLATIRAKVFNLTAEIDAAAALILNADEEKRPALETQLELLQDEITFWKCKLPQHERESPAPIKDQTWIVRFPLSERALQIANGYTDLADIASHPHDMESTLQEIALAVMIAVQHDGVKVEATPNGQTEIDKINIDERLSKRKELLEECNFFRLEVIKAIARYERLLQKLEDIALGNANVHVNDTLRHERQSAAMSHHPKIEELRPSIDAWKSAFKDS